MSIDDPYKISATNNPIDKPGADMPSANRSGKFKLAASDLSASEAIDETQRLKEVVVIVREPEDEEQDDEKRDDNNTIPRPGDLLKPKPAGPFLNSTMISLFAGAAFLVILFALLIARGGGTDGKVYCRDLPEWNRSANCI